MCAIRQSGICATSPWPETSAAVVLKIALAAAGRISKANGWDLYWPLKEYDLILQLAGNGVSEQQEDNDGVDSVQFCVAKTLVASGKRELALVAAKSYYNVCKLDNTPKAIDLVVLALANPGLEQDAAMIRRFRMQQAAGAMVPVSTVATATSPSSQPATHGENILKSIKVDAAPYQAALENFDLIARDFVTLSAQGNLLLLADQPTEAKTQFEASFELARNSRQTIQAVENIARAIRAENNGVGPANAYILSLRHTDTVPLAQSTAAALVHLATIQKWVGPIDSYGPPHEEHGPRRPEPLPGDYMLPPEPVAFAHGSQSRRFRPGHPGWKNGRPACSMRIK